MEAIQLVFPLSDEHEVTLGILIPADSESIVSGIKDLAIILQDTHE
jgi:hypothetical protein